MKIQIIKKPKNNNSEIMYYKSTTSSWDIKIVPEDNLLHVLRDKQIELF